MVYMAKMGEDYRHHPLYSITTISFLDYRMVQASSVPIDIAVGKMLDWLVDRRHCNARYVPRISGVSIGTKSFRTNYFTICFAVEGQSCTRIFRQILVP